MALDREDVGGLDDLPETTRNRFHRVILLHTGTKGIPFVKPDSLDNDADGGQTRESIPI